MAKKPTRVLNGMHFPNSGFSDIEGLLKAVGPTGAITLLHHERGWLDQLRHQAPQRLLHVRMYAPDWRTQDPVRWAEETAETLAPWWDDPAIAVSPANEQNIEPSFSPDMASVAWYEKIGRFNLAWLRRLDQLVPNRRALTITSALADGHEPPGFPADGEYRVGAIRDMLEAFDLVGIHPYGHLEWGAAGVVSVPGGADAFWHMLRPFRPVGWEGPHDIGGVCRQFPYLTFVATEVGTFSHADTARTPLTVAALKDFYAHAANEPNFLAATPFIWDTDAAHPTNNMALNPDLRRAIIALPKFSATPPLPVARIKEPLPMPEPTPPLPTPETPVVGGGLRAALDRLGTQPVLSEQYWRDAAGRQVAWTIDTQGNFALWSDGFEGGGARVVRGGFPNATPQPAPDPMPPAPPSPDALVQLAGFPIWNQLDDWTDDPNGDTNRWNNCGPQSVAMVTKYATGVELPGDFIKDVLYGEAYLGYTFTNDLARFLNTRADIPTDVYGGDANATLRPVVVDALRQGFPVIVLYYLALDKPASGHFCPVYAFNDDGCWRANPLGGKAEFQTWAEFERWQKQGVAIVCKRKRTHV